jgi:adenylate kinase
MMNIVLIGPSGVGKGTHAGKLVAKYDLQHVVTGELFWENLEKRAAVGLLAKRYLATGELVPDEVVDAMIEEWLWHADPDKGVLFDGFPRTVYQAHFLDDLFKQIGRQLEAVIYLNVSDEKVLKRLTGRIICRQCQTPYHLHFKLPANQGICDLCGGELYQRPDDIPEIARVRLRAFNRVTGLVLEYYQQAGKLIIIDGEGAIDHVYQAVDETVGQVQRHEARFAALGELDQILIGKSVFAPPAFEAVAHPSFDLVLIGGPGSGKGTQAEQLRNQLKLPHIASGDLFRENLKHGTDLGKLAKSYMDQGQLVPDDVTEAMVEARIGRPDASDGFILDGFPRTLPQAQALTQMMADMHRQLDAVLHIKVSDEELVSRLSGRLICRRCQTPYHLRFKPPASEGVCDACGGELYQRDDDNPSTVGARLKTFRRQTAPLIDYYDRAGLLIEIDGEGDVSEVTGRTLAAVQALT